MNTPTRRTVAAGLRDGYGAEDIAVRNSIPLRDVRFIIAALRRSGHLLPILRAGRNPIINTGETQ